MTVHARAAEDTVLEILSEHHMGPVVFHWFIGAEVTLERVLKAGHYIGVNPAMIASQSGRVVVASCPRDRIMTETDGPYGKCGKKPCHPRDVSLVIRYLASRWQIPEKDVEATVSENFRRVVTA